MKKVLSCVLIACCVALAGAEPVLLDSAIARSAEKIAGSLEKGTRVAVLTCTSPSEKLSEYVVRETVSALVNTGTLVVLEREDIDLVKKELQFQLSGDVSDETAQSVGKLLGAEVIVTCSVDESSVLRVKAIAVETARIVAAESAQIQDTGRIESLGDNIVLVMDCAVNGADRSLAATINGIMVSAVSGAKGFRAVSAESRDKALGETKFSASDITNEKERMRVGRMTAAESILTAKLSLESGLLFLTLTRVNVGTGTIISSSTETYRSSGTLLEGARGQTLRCLGADVATDDRRVIRVTNLTELIGAIGPDRIIMIAEGVYDLSKGFEIKNKYVTWVDEYDGPCPVIKSVSNLAFVGEGKATLVIKPAYGWVFSFDTCSGIRVSGLVIGHTVPGYCLGGVLRFRNCDDTEIRSCELYGSGTYGISLERASRFSMEDCAIHDCTFGLATIERSSEISFTNTAFSDTGEYDLISVQATDHVLWTDCTFENNRGSALFSVDGESRDLRLVRCEFKDNHIDTFCDDPDAFEVEGAIFTSNAFKPYRN